MTDLSKFKKDSEKLKMPEAAVYLLKYFSVKFDDLSLMVAKLYEHFNVVCGTYTTVGGSSTEEMLNSSIKSGMSCVIQMKQVGVSPVTIVTAECQPGKIVIT